MIKFNKKTVKITGVIIEDDALPARAAIEAHAVVSTDIETCAEMDAITCRQLKD